MIESGSLRIAHLADHPEVVPTLTDWFETEWSAWYYPGGPGAWGGRGDARTDLLNASKKDALPVGLVAFLDGELVGTATLKAQSIPTHAHLTPWATAGLVRKDQRGRGIGAELLAALEDVAKRLGYPRISCATSKAESLLRRSGWFFMEHAAYDGADLLIYEKVL